MNQQGPAKGHACVALPWFDLVGTWQERLAGTPVNYYYYYQCFTLV